MAEETLAWRMIKPGWKVVGRDGTAVGTVGRVLADDGADIFHGIALRHGVSGLGEEREVVAARIDRITEDAVHTSLDPAEVEGLAPAR
jgi:hypothetical protein